MVDFPNCYQDTRTLNPTESLKVRSYPKMIKHDTETTQPYSYTEK